MVAIVGGLRARLIRDSVYRAVYDALAELGWFADQQSRSPVTFVLEPVDINAVVAPNTAALADEDQSGEDAEMGSNLTDFAWVMYVDFYAENDAVALHFIGDVAAILEGRLPSVGRGRPIVTVYDWTLATPAEIFTVEIDGVRVDRAHGFPHPWLRHWRSCSFRVLDTHGDEADP